MTSADFALALTGMGHTRCEFEVSGLELIGKVREHKTEVLPAIDVATHSSCRDTVARLIVSRCESDGWVGRWKDMLNRHNAVKLVDGRDGRRVTFVRYVDAPPTEGSEVTANEEEVGWYTEEDQRRDIADSQGH